MKKFILTVFLLFPTLALALPAEPFSWYPNLKKVGDAEFGVLFVDVYDIDLYQDKDTPVNMIHITYHMDLKAKKRINSALKDIAKMPTYEKAPFKAWETQMKAFFPDVKKGDTISIFKTVDDHAVFYYNNQYRAEINDAYFTKAFFDIWLGEETPNKGMKKDLLKKAFHK